MSSAINSNIFKIIVNGKVEIINLGGNLILLFKKTYARKNDSIF